MSHLKFSLFVLILISVFPTINGQHCGWDMTSIIIVEVVDKESGEIINGLNITLADSEGIAYTSRWNLRNNKHLSFYQKTDTLKFGQNLKKKSKKFSQVQGPFSFGVNTYLLLVYYNNYPHFNKEGTDLIIIKDIDGEKNLGKFKTKTLTFSQDNISGLCVDAPIWRDDKAVNKVKIKVELEKIK